MAEPTTEPHLISKPPQPQPPPPPLPPPQTQLSSSWGTLEELLLACAVNRYGTDSWDAVAKELNTRRSAPSASPFTPSYCRQKYIDLKRRFSAADDGGAVGDEEDTAVWLDELRRLRVAELKRELHRYDLSIVSLQLKVKRLREERERSVKEESEKEDRETSDLKENYDVDTKQPESCRRNVDSVDESNYIDPKPEPVEREPERSGGAVRGDGSCNGSSNSKEEEQEVEEERVERVGGVDSGELGESVAESRRDGEEGEGVKESSDVQSTLSLFRRREKKVSGSSSGEENQSLGSKFSGGDDGGGGGKGEGKGEGDCESKALVGFLDVVRARWVGSVFESRLESQETLRYKSLIKEHIDLGIVQKRVDSGHYTDCQTKFYRDLMLLINNAIVFFPKRSSEYKAATDLRQLVTKHFESQLCVKKTRASNSTPPLAPPKLAKPEVDQVDLDLKPKLAITGPLIACRKRTSVVGKLPAVEAEKKELAVVTPPVRVKGVGGDVSKQESEKSSPTLFNAVTKKRSRDQSFGSRSSSSKNNSSGSRSTRPSSSPARKPSSETPISSKGETAETKADTRKPGPGNSSNKMKQGARPSKDLLLDALSNAEKRKICSNVGSGGNVRSDRRKEQNHKAQNGSSHQPSKDKGKSKEEKESPRSSRGLGRPPKRAAAMSAVGKRGRDGSGDADDKSKKRPRR